MLPGRPNVVATAEFGPGGPTLVLNGHTDVVAVGEGWDGDPFSGAIRDGSCTGGGCRHEGAAGGDDSGRPGGAPLGNQYIWAGRS